MHKKYKILLLSLLVVLMFTSCSRYAPIVKVDESESHYIGAVYQPELNYKSDETTDSTKYRIYHQAATGYIGKQTVLNSVHAAMKKFCDKKKKDVLTLEEYTVSGIGLGKFPSAEVIFACVDIKDTASTVSNISASNKLKELKQMKEDGLITQEEHDAKKREILNNY